MYFLLGAGASEEEPVGPRRSESGLKVIIYFRESFLLQNILVVSICILHDEKAQIVKRGETASDS